MLALRTVLLCSSLGLLACGGGAPKGPTPEQKAAEAKKAADDAEVEAKALAERKAKREADEAKQAEADKKVADEVERLTATLPEKLPKDPVAACDAVGKAQDAFVRRTGDAKAIEAWDAGGKDKALPMTIVQCTQADSVKTAACQKAAFDGAGAELKDQSKKLMQVCIDKYANKKAPPAGMPQRRPG